MSKAKVSWDNIIDDFFSGRYRVIERNPRNGLRGRLFQELVKKLLVYDGFTFQHEVTFDPKPIDSDFKKKAISIDESINVNQKGYTIDFVLGNGTWIEVTLNIHTAHEKPLKYAHQCEKLVVLYIDKTTKRRVGNVFNNVKIISVFKFFSKKAIRNYRREISKLVEYKGYMQ